MLTNSLKLLAALSISALAVGCAAGGESASDERQEVASKTPPMNLKVGLPEGVVEKKSGTGSLSYTADQSGTVYLYDLSMNKTVGTFNITEGQELLLSGQSGRATVGGNEIALNEKPSAGRTYIVYMLPRDGQQSQGRGRANVNGQRYDLRVVPSEEE